jgi:hypothetical protein
MKINKVLIRTLHFFGLCNDQQHIDDVSVRILDNSIQKKLTIHMKIFVLIGNLMFICLLRVITTLVTLKN